MILTLVGCISIPAKIILYRRDGMVLIVREWNNLPRYIVEAGNLRRFKATLESCMSIS